MTERNDLFLVPFLGETIACETTADAEAVRLADAVLTGRQGYRRTELPHLEDGSPRDTWSSVISRRLRRVGSLVRAFVFVLTRRRRTGE